ncbi:MAG TPA: hypothetical protein VFQ88_00470, partial [Nevskiaceae bacterium]|nr:hypothetical protein [Nevskiaceae bacterium]
MAPESTHGFALHAHSARGFAAVLLCSLMTVAAAQTLPRVPTATRGILGMPLGAVEADLPQTRRLTVVLGLTPRDAPGLKTLIAR